MNTTLLVQQLTVAIIASAIIIPFVQRVKGWLPKQWMVEPTSVIIAFVTGVAVAWYYNGYDPIACLWVGLFSVIGAESIYKLVAEKLATYTEKKDIWETIQKSDDSAELAHLLEANDPSVVTADGGNDGENK